MDIETIYRLYFRDVCLFLQGLTRSETLAEELTQETFFRALDGLEDYDGKQDVRAWLFTVARNAYYDHCRRAKHAAPLEDAETKAADSPDIAQLLVDKDAALYVRDADAPATLLPLAMKTVADEARLQALSQHILQLGLPDSADVIAREVMKLRK